MLREPNPPVARARTRGEIGRLIVEVVLGGEPVPPWLKRLVASGAVAVALIVVGVWWWSANQASTQRSDGGLAPPVTAVPFTTDGGSSTTTAAPDLIVHAAGAVARPGLYRMPSGARVGELIEAAGGLAADADADRINLAGVLADGARVYVPRAGEIVPEVAVGPQVDGAGGVPPGASGSPGGSAGGQIDVNTATVEALEELPGVGPATAAAIVDHREENGPFRSVDGLLDVRGIGPAKLDALRDLVRV
jgi:competence protein ComEA